MQIITKETLFEKKEFYKQKILQEQIFIYSTDTIYGIGCNALDANAIKKIRELKQRDAKPFSVIAPNKIWIKENCVLNENANKWIAKLPGPFTFILNLKNKNAIASEVNQGMTSLGVRIPNHWISDFVNYAGIPIITTSVNVSGQPFLVDLNELPDAIKQGVDFAIDSGILDNKPSTLMDLTEKEEKIIQR